MNGRALYRILLSVVACLAIVACAGPKVDTTAPATNPERTADTYAAEALATYQLQRDGGRTLNLMSAAVQLAPRRQDLAYLNARFCVLIEGCSTEPFDARLRTLDPKNAVIWLNALTNAQRQHDAAAEVQVLDAMARSERFDIHWNSLVADLALARVKGAKGTEVVLNETIGWLATTIVPSFQPLALGCSKSRTADPQWAQRCRHIANLLLNSDTYAAEMVGLTLAQQVTMDPVARAPLLDRARTRSYLWQLSGEIVTVQIEKDKFAAEQIQLMKSLPREQDVHSAIVRWAGRSMTPPPDFRLE